MKTSFHEFFRMMCGVLLLSLLAGCSGGGGTTAGGGSSGNSRLSRVNADQPEHRVRYDQAV